MRVLAIVHQPDAGLGVFADAILGAGATLDCWRVPEGDDPPGDPRRYGAVLSLGGAVHPDQDREHAWLAAEKAILADLIDRDVPLLGVCLGAELIAAAAGATPRRADPPEIGWHEVQVTAAGLADPVLAPLAPGFEALEWHSYQLPLPPGATPLAFSATCLQAYRLGAAAWGIQFHAEVTLEDFEAWLDDYQSDPDAVRSGLNPSELRRRTRPAMAAWNELGRALCRRFLAAAAGGAPRDRL